MLNYLLQPVTLLKGVGPSIAEKLEKLGINSIQDLLFHLPYRYQDRTRILKIRDLREGDYALIKGEIVKSQIKFGKKRHLLVTLTDKTGFVQLRFFHFTKKQQDRLSPGTMLQCFGEVHHWNGQCVIVHPEYRDATEEIQTQVEENLTPIYPSTEGLHQRFWLKFTAEALLFLTADTLIEEYLPAEILAKYAFMPLSEALLYLHRPPPDADQNLLLNGQHPAQKRLAFEELLAHQLSMHRLRQSVQNHRAHLLKVNPELTENFCNNLPFKLTLAQERVKTEIFADLNTHVPMLRLLQGDVGSGKTIIAALAALQAVSSGCQVAIMAPTEILAEQHYKNFLAWFEPYSIKISCLISSMPAKIKTTQIAAIANAESQIIVGTHALFQMGIEFKKLGLIVIDEQHRFGVNQRMALREKGFKEQCYPHQLIMTATPIPRTLAMTAYADLDVSILDELPPGRIEIKTSVLNQQKRVELIEGVLARCQQGEQIYWVCPLIEESEVLECEAAEKIFEELKIILPELTIGLIHGRMRSQEKDAVMQAFSAGQINLLVATTVIEVGVNVPNATLMVIENAERLGLAQLHQLRGRVGRGVKESHCVLLYKSPLSQLAQNRLAIMRKTTDGFILAEEDLKNRGSGEILGTRQTGLQQFKIADLLRDKDLLQEVRLVSKYFFNQSDLTQKLISRWLGQRENYVHA